MATRRRFSKTFKRQIVEEFLSGSVTQAQLARRYDISPHLIIQWRKHYAAGRLVEHTHDTARDERIRELERMVGRLTMENELLKKAVQHTLRERNEQSSIISGPGPGRSNGGAG
jgi:transposase